MDLDLPLPSPESSLAAYTLDRVLRAKAYAELRLTSQAYKPSPTFADFLKLYSGACDQYLRVSSSPTGFTKGQFNALVSEIRKYEVDMDQSAWLERAYNQRNQHEIEELINLRRLKMWAFYGDYVGQACQELGLTASLYDTERHEVPGAKNK